MSFGIVTPYCGWSVDMQVNDKGHVTTEICSAWRIRIAKTSGMGLEGQEIEDFSSPHFQVVEKKARELASTTRSYFGINGINYFHPFVYVPPYGSFMSVALFIDDVTGFFPVEVFLDKPEVIGRGRLNRFHQTVQTAAAVAQKKGLPLISNFYIDYHEYPRGIAGIFTPHSHVKQLYISIVDKMQKH